MQVLIATPTTGDVVTSAYAHSLIAATQAFNAAGWQYDHLVFNGADIELARNYMASELLKEEYLSHILFLDTDMLVERVVFERLIQADQAIAGAIYSDQSMNWPRYGEMVRSGASEGVARAASTRFNVRLIDENVDVRNGWCQVAALGAGCLMIKREVFLTLIRTESARKTHSWALETHLGDGDLYNFFDKISIKNGDKLPEDFSFCVRARKAGFEIWAMADVAIGHVGRHDYAARYVDYLSKAAQAQELTTSET